jgi:hypothetical protein
LAVAILAGISLALAGADVHAEAKVSPKAMADAVHAVIKADRTVLRAALLIAYRTKRSS